jgi:hypothetical protein
LRGEGSASASGLVVAASNSIGGMRAGDGSTHTSEESLAAASGALQSTLNEALANAYVEEQQSQTSSYGASSSNSLPATNQKEPVQKQRSCENDGGGRVSRPDGSQWCKFEGNNRWVPYY